jgi:poly(3-hydroxybutyrate) depolymerase
MDNLRSFFVSGLLLSFFICPLSALALGGSQPKKPVEDPIDIEDPIGSPVEEWQNPYTLGAGSHPGNNKADVFQISVGTENRTYRVYAPISYDNRVPTPVVLAFHGGGASQFGGYGLKISSNLDAAANSSGFIVVYPDALATPSTGSAVWNADDDSLPGIPEGSFHLMPSMPVARDVEFVRALVEDLKANFNVDSTKVYATGFSNGAQMAYKLACDASDIIAAIAPVGATGLVGAYWDNGNISLDPANCSVARNVPILHIHGSSDWCVVPDANTSGGCLTTMDILATQIYPSDRYFAYKKSSKRSQIRDEVRSTLVPVLSDHSLSLPSSFASTLAAKFFSPSLSIADQIAYFRSQIMLGRTVSYPITTNRSSIAAGSPYLQSWASAAQCSSTEFKTQTVGNLNAERGLYRDCNNKSQIEILYLLGHGHSWAGGNNKDFSFCDTSDPYQLELCELYVESIMGKTAPTANINAIIWEFFSRFSL